MRLFLVLYGILWRLKNSTKNLKFSIQCFYGVNYRKKDNEVLRSGRFISYPS